MRQRAKLRVSILSLLALKRRQSGVRGRRLWLLMGRLLALRRDAAEGCQTRLLLLWWWLLLGYSRSLLLVLTRILRGKVLRRARCVRVVTGIEGVAIHDSEQRAACRRKRNEFGIVLALQPCSSNAHNSLECGLAALTQREGAGAFRACGTRRHSPCNEALADPADTSRNQLGSAHQMVDALRCGVGRVEWRGGLLRG